MGLPKLESWQVEALRFSLFFAVPVNAQHQKWWESFAGREAEAKVNKPHLGEYTETGSFLDGQCELKILFNRVDWAVSFPFAGLPHSPSHLELKVLLAEWLMAISRWMNNEGFTPQRIALGVAMIVPVASEKFSNSVIESFFPFVDFTSKNLIDIAIQVNSPTPSLRLPGLSINRLVRLNTATRQIVNMAASGVPVVEADTVLRCDLDINTSPQWINLFGVRSAIDIVEEMIGDVEVILTKSI